MCKEKPRTYRTGALPSPCLLLSRQSTGLNGARGINGVRPFVDVANDAVLIDHEGDAVGEEANEAEDSISLGHLLFRVAKQRKACPRFFGKLAVSVLAVETDPQHLRPRG